VRIDYNLPAGNKVDISIYNRAGQIVTKFTSESNQNHYIWDGCDENSNRVGAGVYFIKLSTPIQDFTEKVILLQ
jgi:flagellar hook assembly protein FlgD